MAEFVGLAFALVAFLALLCFVLAIIVRNANLSDFLGYAGTALFLFFVVGMILLAFLGLLDLVLEKV